MTQQAGALIEQQQIFILIDQIQLRPEHGEKGIFLPGGVKEFVVDVQLQHITGG